MVPAVTSPEPGSSRRIWIDGRLVPWADASVHVLSHSLQRGSLVFDYLSVHETPRGPAVFRLPDHLERFFLSCGLVGLPLEADAAAVRAAVCETVRANPGATSCKVFAYFASVEVDVVPLDTHVTLAVAAYDPWHDIVAGKQARPGVPPARKDRLSVRIEQGIRNRRSDILSPQAKTAANYTSPMAAKWKAVREGYDEVLLLDDEGFVAEGPTTNVFAVDEAGGLVTPPPAKVLHGVTRRSLLEIAKHDGRAVREAHIRPDDLRAAPEVFLSGTTANVMPVVALDGEPVGHGEPGPVTLALRDRFREIRSGRDADFSHWLTFVDEE